MVIVLYILISLAFTGTTSAQEFDNHLKHQYHMTFQNYPQLYERCPRYNTMPPYHNYFELETSLLTDSFFSNNLITFIPENDIFNAALFQDTNSMLLVPEQLSEFFFKHLYNFNPSLYKDVYKIYYLGEMKYSENYKTEVFICERKNTSGCTYVELFIINHNQGKISSSISLSQYFISSSSFLASSYLNSARIFGDGVIVWFDSAAHAGIHQCIIGRFPIHSAINFFKFRRNRAYRFGPCAHLRIHETKGTIETVRSWKCCK